jgi:hypothetical protein
MTRVALINPGTAQRLGITEPLNLGFIAAHLERAGIYFADDDLFCSKKRLASLRELTLGEGLRLRWSCQPASPRWTKRF